MLEILALSAVRLGVKQEVDCYMEEWVDGSDPPKESNFTPPVGSSLHD